MQNQGRCSGRRAPYSSTSGSSTSWCVHARLSIRPLTRDMFSPLVGAACKVTRWVVVSNHQPVCCATPLSSIDRTTGEGPHLGLDRGPLHQRRDGRHRVRRSVSPSLPPDGWTTRRCLKAPVFLSLVVRLSPAQDNHETSPFNPHEHTYIHITAITFQNAQGGASHPHPHTHTRTPRTDTPHAMAPIPSTRPLPIHTSTIAITFQNAQGGASDEQAVLLLLSLMNWDFARITSQVCV